MARHPASHSATGLSQAFPLAWRGAFEEYPVQYCCCCWQSISPRRFEAPREKIATHSFLMGGGGRGLSETVRFVPADFECPTAWQGILEVTQLEHGTWRLHRICRGHQSTMASRLPIKTLSRIITLYFVPCGCDSFDTDGEQISGRDPSSFRAAKQRRVDWHGVVSISKTWGKAYCTGYDIVGSHGASSRDHACIELVPRCRSAWCVAAGFHTGRPPRIPEPRGPRVPRRTWCWRRASPALAAPHILLRFLTSGSGSADTAKLRPRNGVLKVQQTCDGNYSAAPAGGTSLDEPHVTVQTILRHLICSIKASGL